jgi:hypothetical protein
MTRTAIETLDLLYIRGTGCLHRQGTLKMAVTPYSKACVHLRDQNLSKPKWQQGIYLKTAFRDLPGRPEDRITATLAFSGLLTTVYPRT